MRFWTGAKLVYPMGHRARKHRHDSVQVFFVISGLLNLTTERGSWVVPPGHLGCIKPGVTHWSNTLSGLEAWSVFCPKPKTFSLGEDINILRSSALLKSLLERVVDRKKLNLREALDRSVAALIMSEMSQARVEPLGIPLPSSPRLVKVARLILARSSEGKNVADWAKEAGMSVRSFSRHFHAETGLTFERWRTLANHQKAIELMCNGENVTSVALTLGYESVSAFIASFRKHHGTSPLRFLKRM